ncbi:EpsG family protein [Aquitalea sp. S1-19]|nr:EpsG family protein [Aquitalea sp. S1-19]
MNQSNNEHNSVKISKQILPTVLLTTIATITAIRGEVEGDYGNYVYFYSLVGDLFSWSDIASYYALTQGSELSFYFISSILKKLYPHHQLVFAFYSIATFFIIYKSIKNFGHITLSGTLIYILLFASAYFVQIRFGLGMALGFYAVTLASNNKKKYAFYQALAIAIHYSAVVFIIPIILIKSSRIRSAINSNIIFITLTSVAFLIGTQLPIGWVLTSINDRYDYYTNEASLNAFSFITKIIIYIAYTSIEKEKTNKTMAVDVMMRSMLLLSALTWSIPIMYRLQLSLLLCTTLIPTITPAKHKDTKYHIAIFILIGFSAINFYRVIDYLNGYTIYVQ